MTKKLDIPERHWDAMFAPSSALTIITSVSAAGAVNAAAFGTCTRVAHDPVYVLFALTAEPPSDTCSNVLATNQFVVNVVRFDPDLLSRVRTVGLPFEPGVDELERAGLTALPSIRTTPPRIAECPVHFECELAWTQRFENRMVICGRVVAVSADEDCYEPRGVLVWDRARPAHYCGAPYDGNFVPAHQPLYVPRTYDGPKDWRSGVVVDDPPDILTHRDLSVEYGGVGSPRAGQPRT